MDNLLGKDRSLEDSLQKLQSLLEQMGFDLQEERLLNPAPGLWSVHLEDKDSRLYSNGKGASEKAALVSAYAEFLERLGTGFFLADFPHTQSYSVAPDEVIVSLEYWDPTLVLNESLWNFYDPQRQLEREDFIDPAWDGDPRISLLPMKNRAGEEILVPTSLLKELYASNGLSIGNSPLEARVQALSEIIERYVRYEILRQGYTLPEVPQKSLEQWVNWEVIKGAFEAQGYSIGVLDGSLGRGLPVVCVVLKRPDRGQVMLSFGAHPNPKVALERTLTELMQGRDFTRLPDLVFPHWDHQACSDPVNLESHFINSVGLVPLTFFKKKADFDYRPWGVQGSRQQEWDYITGLIAQEEILVWEKPAGEFTLVRMVVPGMSEIYPLEDLLEHTKEERRSLRRFLLDPLGPSPQWDLFPFHPEDPLAELTGLPLGGWGLWEELSYGEIMTLAQLVSGEEGEHEIALLNPENKSGSGGAFLAAVQMVYFGGDSVDLQALFDRDILKEARGLVADKKWPLELLPPLGEFNRLPALQGVQRLRDKITSFWNG